MVPAQCPPTQEKKSVVEMLEVKNEGLEREGEAGKPGKRIERK